MLLQVNCRAHLGWFLSRVSGCMAISGGLQTCCVCRHVGSCRLSPMPAGLNNDWQTPVSLAMRFEAEPRLAALMQCACQQVCLAMIICCQLRLLASLLEGLAAHLARAGLHLRADRANAEGFPLRLSDQEHACQAPGSFLQLLNFSVVSADQRHPQHQLSCRCLLQAVLMDGKQRAARAERPADEITLAKVRSASRSQRLPTQLMIRRLPHQQTLARSHLCGPSPV